MPQIPLSRRSFLLASSDILFYLYIRRKQAEQNSNIFQYRSIVIFGDSISAGYGASSLASSFPMLLARELNLSLENLATASTTILQHIVDQIEPYATNIDVAVLLTGYNDMRAGTSLEQYSHYLNRAMSILRMKSSLVVIGNCLRMTSEGYSAYGPLWNHGNDQIVESMNNIITQQCKLQGALLADISRVYDPALHTSADLVHPNDLGHALIAKIFAEALRRPFLWLPLVSS